MKEKDNMIIKVLLLIFILSTLGLVVYIAHDKILSKRNENNDNKEPQIIKSSYQHDLTKRKNIQATQSGHFNILVDTEGNAYLYTEFAAGEKENLLSIIKTAIEKVEAKYNTYSPKGYDRYGSTSLQAYKLELTGVLSVQYINIGNAGGAFVFIKENGKVSYLLYDSLLTEGNLDIKNIDNLTDVISIVDDTYDHMPYAIMSDGKEVSLSNYIY